MSAYHEPACDAGQVINRIEAMQAGVGVLTVAHGALRGSEDTDDIRAALSLLRHGALDITMDVGGVPAECDAIVRQKAQEVAEELSQRAQLMVNGCVKAFIEVAAAYERDCPDADIPAILQKAALDLSTEKFGKDN
jgi:hypothetical protein